MKSEVHILSAVVFTALISMVLNLSASSMTVWILISAIASFGIDLDHLFLAYFIGDKREEVRRYLAHPSGRLEDRIGYDGLLRHSVVTHGLTLVLVILGAAQISLLVPAALGISIHFLQDFYSHLF